MNEAPQTATALATMRDADLRTDRRRLRAVSLASAVMRVIAPYLRDEDGGECRDAYYALLELFVTSGVDVVADADRREAGLSPRDDKGWTQEELRAFEMAKMSLLLRPITFQMHQTDRLQPTRPSPVPAPLPGSNQ